MSVAWYVMTGEVHFSSSKILRITEGATTSSCTIPAGTRYLRGDGSSDDLLKVFKDALEGAGASLNTYTVTLTNNVLAPTGGSPCFVVTIARATGSDSFSLLWADAQTTLDPALFGFAVSNTSHDASAKTSTLCPSSIWCADMPPSMDDPGAERDAAQERMEDGQVYTFDLGGPYTTRTIGFDFVDPSRTLASNSSSGAQGDFEGWWGLHGDGRSFEIWAAEAASSTSIEGLTTATDLGTYVLDEQTLSGFTPNRKEPGLELYDWTIGLRGYVS